MNHTNIVCQENVIKPGSGIITKMERRVGNMANPKRNSSFRPRMMSIPNVIPITDISK